MHDVTYKLAYKFDFFVNQEQAKCVMYQNELKNSSVTSRTLVEVCTAGCVNAC